MTAPEINEELMEKLNQEIKAELSSDTKERREMIAILKKICEEIELEKKKGK